MEKIVEIRPVKESTADYEAIEERIKEAFKKLLYYPLLEELERSRSVLTNASDVLTEALQAGTITYSRGTFSGKFDSRISKELRKLGAKWDRSELTYKLTLADIPRDVREAISVSQIRFKEKLKRIDDRLARILPEEIAGSIKSADLFSSTLWKVDRAVGDSLKSITVAPKLTAEQRKRIADEWQGNLDLWIKDFTKEEIEKLRKSMRESTFAGNRYEAAIKTVQRSFQVTANKAKFLARQETNLLIAKFKETRYADSGVTEYKWGCVAGSKNHPVRPSHKILEGKIFSWDNPPVTTAPDEPVRKNNPGQDYNCRCFAKPIVRFKEKSK